MFFLPETSAIIDGRSGQRSSGIDLNREIRLRAARLQAHGLEQRSIVVIAHGGSADFFVDLFAVWHSGACAAVINPGLTAPELENIAGFVGAKWIITDGDAGLPQKIDDAACIDLSIGPDSSQAPDLRPTHFDDDCLILFTSGTTGDPKGVVHSFRSIYSRVTLNQAFMGDAVLNTTLCTLPTHFGHGLIGNCLTPLLAGHTLVLRAGSGLADARAIPEVIEEYNVSFMSSVPTLWKLILKMAKSPGENGLKRISVGSAPMSADLWLAISDWAGGTTVANMYGITETANWIAGASSDVFEPQDGLVGTMWGGSAAVLAEDGNISFSGLGELLLMPPSLMTRYFERPDLTEQAFMGGWYRTGDVGTISAKGVIRIVGREKHEINRAGIKIHPEEIDTLLERHPLVTEACTFGMPDDVAGETVGIAVTLASTQDITVSELRSWALERLKRESVPERWFVVDEIPKTDRGKINRQKVLEYCLNLGNEE
jgi:oxalate---CoA ligase